jgi:hypothetical protein
MKFTYKTLNVSLAVKKIKNLSLDLSPEYQRGPVWSKPRQALLVDSMLKGYDLPKFYVRELSSDDDREIYEVVDGLQRLTSMVNFMSGDFSLPKESIHAGLKYSDLPENVGEIFDSYQLNFTVLVGFEDSDVRDMFLRLQNGLKLNAAEELNAVPGEMHDFVESLSKMPFFEKHTSFTSSRGAYRHVAAQISLLALVGYGDARKQDLVKFYNAYKDSKPEELARQLRQVLVWLESAFQERDPALRNRGQTVSIVMATFDLWGKYVLHGSQKSFVDAVHSFDAELVRGNKNLKDYSTAISHSSDQGKSIEIRREFLLAHLSEYIKGLAPKDSRRAFSLPDRILAWYESGGKCQTPGCMNKINFQDFHADHISPWAKGGQTTLDNLQVLCPQHNLSKGAKI